MTSNCCSQSTLLTFCTRKRIYEPPEYEPEYVECEPCSNDVDGCPTIIQHGNNNDEAGPSGVRPCDPSEEPKCVYPKLPSVKLRKQGAIYEVTTGVYKRWTGRYLQPMCRDCPENAKKHACYRDADGKHNRLCGPCAKQAGTWTVRHPCRDCPEHAKTQSCQPDEHGNQRRLCGPCAKQAGTWTVLNPCRDCPEHAKTQSCQPDEHGNQNKLCGPCAKQAGTWTVLNPCRDCPDDAKTHSGYPDEHGNQDKLCGPCAKQAGTWTVQNPCRDCPEDAKKHANYPDEHGNQHKLCGPCAKEAGTWTVLNPCRDCPEDAKTQSAYPDEHGNKNKLCGPCAIDAGLKPEGTPRASMVACRCWHRLENVSKAKLTHHICCLDPTKWIGDEKKGLIPGRHLKPDAYIEPDLPIHLEGQTSGPKGAVFLFHGNEWHGYPEGHPKYDDVNQHGDSYKELYHKTRAHEELYRKEGYRVFVVWEHEFGECEKARCPVHIQNVIREV